MKRAADTVERAVSLMQRAPMLLMLLGAVYARGNRVDEARQVLEELQQRSAHVYGLWIHAYLEETDRVFELVEAGLRDRHPVIIQAFILWPPFKQLREDPRYPALLKKYGLERLAEVSPERTS
jgi:hypothetical protein